MGGLLLSMWGCSGPLCTARTLLRACPGQKPGLGRILGSVARIAIPFLPFGGNPDIPQRPKPGPWLPGVRNTTSGDAASTPTRVPPVGPFDRVPAWFSVFVAWVPDDIPWDAAPKRAAPAGHSTEVWLLAAPWAPVWAVLALGAADQGRARQSSNDRRATNVSAVWCRIGSKKDKAIKNGHFGRFWLLERPAGGLLKPMGGCLPKWANMAHNRTLRVLDKFPTNPSGDTRGGYGLVRTR